MALAPSPAPMVLLRPISPSGASSLLPPPPALPPLLPPAARTRCHQRRSGPLPPATTRCMNRSPMEDEGNYEKDLQPEDVVADEDMRYDSEENHELKAKEKPVGPPLNLMVPLKQSPAHPDKMNVIKVSNIMGIDPKPFDPKTYVEEDVFVFVADESRTNKRIRLEDNIVRWRTVKNADGTTSTLESSQKFCRIPSQMFLLQKSLRLALLALVAILGLIS